MRDAHGYPRFKRTREGAVWLHHMLEGAAQRIGLDKDEIVVLFDACHLWPHVRAMAEAASSPPVQCQPGRGKVTRSRRRAHSPASQVPSREEVTMSQDRDNDARIIAQVVSTQHKAGLPALAAWVLEAPDTRWEQIARALCSTDDRPARHVAKAVAELAGAVAEYPELPQALVDAGRRVTTPDEADSEAQRWARLITEPAKSRRRRRGARV